MPYSCLQGLHVVDFGIITAGANTSAMLADLGAEVIKVEGPAYIDPFRTWTGISGDAEWWNKSPHFSFTNRNKRSLCVDLKSQRGRELILDLIARSHILVENFRVGVLDRLGLGFEAASKANPRIIFASISSQGASGPQADSVSFGSTLEASSGLSSMIRTQDGEPLISGHALNYPDQIVSMFTLGIIMAALVQQRKTAGPIHLDIAQRELTAYMLGEALAAQGRTDAGSGPGAPAAMQDVVRAGDGNFVAYSFSSPVAAARIDDTSGAEELNPADIASAVADLRVSDSVRWLRVAGASAEQVRVAAELADMGNAATLAYASDSAGRPVKGLPWRRGGHAAGISRPAPGLGEDNEYVIREVLGLGPEQYRELIEQQVLATAPHAKKRVVDRK